MTMLPDAPAAAPGEPACPRRKSPVAIPWRDIACRLAEGAKPAAIAADLGLKEDRIWRHLRQSLRFRFYLRQAIERQRMLAGLQLVALGQTALLSRALHPESLDGDLLRLLNEAAPTGNLVQQVEKLGETGLSPPNMAFRARLAAERKVMDAEFAEARRVLMALVAAKTGEAARSATNAGEAQRSTANASEALRSATNTSEAVRSPANAGAARTGPPVPSPRPPSPPPEPPRRPIVDLDGPDLERLRAQGLLSRPDS